MVFLAQNFLCTVSILCFSLHSKTSFNSFVLFHEAASRMMLGGSFRVAFQLFHSGVTHSNSALRSRGVRHSSRFPVQAGEKPGTWHYFLTLLKQQPVLWKQTPLKSKNYRGTKWKWIGPDQSNAYLKHYCAVLISWGSTWTLATDCNPLGKENRNTAFEKPRCSHGVHRVYKEQCPDVTAVQSS